MQLDKRQRQERARRKGSSVRMLLQLLWLGITFVIAYFMIEWIFAQGYLTLNMFYRAGIPRAVPTWVIQGGLMLILVVIMQFFVIMGFLIANPRGRRKLGRPTYSTWSQDTDDDRYS